MRPSLYVFPPESSESCQDGDESTAIELKPCKCDNSSALLVWLDGPSKPATVLRQPESSATRMLHWGGVKQLEDREVRRPHHTLERTLSSLALARILLPRKGGRR
jgi:hypothetical protein